MIIPSKNSNRDAYVKAFKAALDEFLSNRAWTDTGPMTALAGRKRHRAALCDSVCRREHRRGSRLQRPAGEPVRIAIAQRPSSSGRSDA